MCSFLASFRARPLRKSIIRAEKFWGDIPFSWRFLPRCDVELFAVCRVALSGLSNLPLIPTRCWCQKRSDGSLWKSGCELNRTSTVMRCWISEIVAFRSKKCGRCLRLLFQFACKQWSAFVCHEILRSKRDLWLHQVNAVTRWFFSEVTARWKQRYLQPADPFRLRCSMKFWSQTWA